MILRIFRARVRPGREDDLAAFIRDDAIAGALRTEGLRSFQPGVRTVSGGRELVLVSTWRDFADIQGAGPSLDSPLAVPGAAEMVEGGRAEHLELVWGSSRALPLRDGVLRIAHLAIQPRFESTYFSDLRAAADGLLDTAGLTALTVGRRTTPTGVEAVVVTIWEDRVALDEALERTGDGRSLFASLAGFQTGPIDVVEFEALAAVAPRSDAPAILVADDESRYIHATPAAARLTGRSVARLLTLRVQDIAGPDIRPQVPELWKQFLDAGASSGSFTVARPNGTEARVVFQARTGVPWPGTHSSLLVPEDEPTDIDLDTALAQSGLVARYPSAD